VRRSGRVVKCLMWTFPRKSVALPRLIAGKPHIVLNREKPLKDLKYTLPHELGHWVLHLNPTGGGNELGFPLRGMEEVEACSPLLGQSGQRTIGNGKKYCSIIQKQSSFSFHG